MFLLDPYHHPPLLLRVRTTFLMLSAKNKLMGGLRKAGIKTSKVNDSAPTRNLNGGAFQLSAPPNVRLQQVHLLISVDGVINLERQVVTVRSLHEGVTLSLSINGIAGHPDGEVFGTVSPLENRDSGTKTIQHIQSSSVESIKFITVFRLQQRRLS